MILFLIFLLCFFISAGNIFIRLLNLKKRDYLTGISLGIVVTSYIMYFLAVGGYLSRTSIIFVMEFIILVNIRIFIALFSDLWRRAYIFLKGLTAWERICFGVLILQIVINFFTAITPATGWDSLAYHLTIPKLILQKGELIHYAEYGGQRYPFLMEMVFTLALMLNGAALVKLLCWSMSVMAAVSVYNLGCRIGGKRLGIISAPVFYNTQVISLWAGKCYIDIALAFFTVMATVFMIEVISGSKGKIPFLIFISILPGIKYTGVILSFILMAVYIISRRHEFLKTSILGLIMVIVFNIPWYPVHNKKINSPHSILYTSVREQSSPVSEYLKRIGFALWRLNLSYDRDGRIGPVFLAFLPLLVFIKQIDRSVRLLLIIGITYIFIFSGFGYIFPRYMVPVMPVLGIVSAYTFLRLTSAGGLLQYFLATWLFSCFIFNPLLTIYNHRLEFGYLTGRIDKHTYIDLRVRCHPAIRYINSKIPDGKVLLIGETRTYYLEREFVLFNVVKRYRGTELDRIIKNYDIRYILVNERIIRRKGDMDAVEILKYLSPRMDLIYNIGYFKIYRIYSE